MGGLPSRSGAGGPIIQKYAGSDPVTPFTKEPQRSLRLTGDDLIRHAFGQRHVLLDTANRGSEPLKLFQPLHDRHYLVVCQLYCDAPGLPPVPQDQVCEAGFVIRRRVAPVAQLSPVQLQEYEALFQRREQLRRQEWLLGAKASAPAAAKAGVRNGIRAARNRVRDGKHAQVRQQLAQVQLELNTLTECNGIQMLEQGWLEDGHPGQGAWTELSGEPMEFDSEVRYPLYPLIPDPSHEDHSGAGTSLWYGLIPTHSGDLDAAGDPRFDANMHYTIRCFVRRHKAGCPRTATPGDCSGELVWSTASECYRLASPYDLDGTSNRPVNIRLPDLDALREQAERAGPGGTIGARFSVPPGSALMMKTDEMNIPDKIGGSGRGDQVCFFAIPLITLVALFVLNIFLPILLFVFQLWWMLRLKLCIPPSIDFSIDLAVELDIKGPEITAKLDAGIGFELQVGGFAFSDSASLRAALHEDLNGATPAGRPRLVTPGEGLDANLIGGLEDLVDNDLDQAVDLLRTLGTDFSEGADPALAGTLPSGADGLFYFQPESRP